jgi:hypothetical protein
MILITIKGGKMFNLFHKHVWEEKERFYAEPVRRKFNLTSVFQEELERLLFGVTTIIYKCKNCPEVKRVEILGKKV